MKRLAFLAVLAFLAGYAWPLTNTPTPTATSTATATNAGLVMMSASVSITPTPNVINGAYSFATPVRAILITNTTSQTIRIKFNSVGSSTDYDTILANNAAVNYTAEDLGLITISAVGVWLPTSSTPAGLVIKGM
jgi:hypothetical protein